MDAMVGLLAESGIKLLQQGEILHPEAFSVRLLPLPNELEGRLDLRFTLDTMEAGER